MIASRRRAHRVLVVVLGPVALLTLFAAVRGRAPEPRVESWPAFLAGPEAGLTGAASAEVLWSREDLFAQWPARVAAHADGTISLKPLRPIGRPDVLLYWAASGGTGTLAALPQDAHLLGRIGDTRVRRFVLPPHGTGDAGPGAALVLYSLGHQEVVASAALPALGEAAP